MAIYNEVLAPRFARGLQKLFGVKGTVPAKQLSGEMMAVHPFFNGRENRYLEGWRTFGNTLQSSAVAAQDSVVRFSNPVGSNTIVVIEGLNFFGSLALETFIDFSANGGNGSLGSANSPAAFDARDKPPGTGQNGAVGILSFANNIGQGNHVVLGHHLVAAAVNGPELINTVNQEFPILPGGDFQLRTVTQNVQLTVNVRWRERTLEESETS